MSTFECDNMVSNLNPNRLREECIIAFKVYDFCRQQDCLTSDILGPARAAECTVLAGTPIEEGAIITPPANSATVSIDRLFIKKVIISDKSPNPFKKGFWDITLKYIFNYRLTFKDVSGASIGCIRATSIFTKKVILFGSIETDVKISTDLFGNTVADTSCEHGMDSGPFVLVESKAVALSAELNNSCCCCDDDAVHPTDVSVSIGLFTIIKLYRIANLTVESRGFCIPDECEDISAVSPCDFFDSLDFPMDIFSPPQKPEFLAGISNNIPAKTTVSPSCGCNNGCNNGCGCCKNN